MVDDRFFETSEPLTIEEACAVAGVRLISVGPDACERVHRVAALDDEAPDDAAAFVDKALALQDLLDRPFALRIAPENAVDENAAGVPSPAAGALALAPEPKVAFARLARRLHVSRPFPSDCAARRPGVDSSARVAPDATIGEGAFIGPCAVIGPGVVIGRDARIGAGVIVSHALIGDRVTLSSGVVVGEEGFGYVLDDGALVRFPQLGIVVIEDDVDIGANSTVDRAALGRTVIGAGTKIDNLVQIGHNVRIGERCVLAAQSGASGSVELGAGAMLGGGVGVADHVTIGAGAMLAGGSGLMHDVPPGERWGGYPAMPARQWMRAVSAARRAGEKTRGKRQADKNRSKATERE